MFISKNKPVPIVKDDPTLLNQPNHDYNAAMRQRRVVEKQEYLQHPDPAQPVAATVGTTQPTDARTYSCSMPYEMFVKLLNHMELPFGFSIEMTYGQSVILLTYDPTADIPRHPDCEVTE